MRDIEWVAAGFFMGSLKMAKSTKKGGKKGGRGC